MKIISDKRAKVLRQFLRTANLCNVNFQIAVALACLLDEFDMHQFTRMESLAWAQSCS